MWRQPACRRTCSPGWRTTSPPMIWGMPRTSCAGSPSRAARIRTRRTPATLATPTTPTTPTTLATPTSSATPISPVSPASQTNPASPIRPVSPAPPRNRAPPRNPAPLTSPSTQPPPAPPEVRSDGHRGTHPHPHRPGRGDLVVPALPGPGHRRIRDRGHQHLRAAPGGLPEVLRRADRGHGDAARGSALAGQIRRPAAAAAVHGTERRRPGDDLPDRHRAGGPRPRGRLRAQPAHLDRTVHGGRRPGDRAAAGPPATTPVHLHLRRGGHRPAAAADAARAG